MPGTTKRDEPAKTPTPTQDRGTPATGTMHSVRKDVTVRLFVSPPVPETDELKEHGYGHGV
jgi:hypothetical protein